MSFAKKAAIALAGLGLIISAGVTYAATSTGKGGPMSNLVNAIAQKFNLNASDVQQVVDETMATEKTQMEAERQQQFSGKISQAVTNGELTQDQADKITAKQKEVQEFMTSLSGKTEDERNTAIKTETESLKQWATDNNIPEQYIQMGFDGKMGRGGPGGTEKPGEIGKGVMGKVTSISGSTITLTGQNGTIYTIDASSAQIKKFTTGTSDTKPTETTISVSDIQVGDNLMIKGTVSGTTVTATEIVDGNFQPRDGHMNPPNR
jgi:hypothetical protein